MTGVLLLTLLAGLAGPDEVVSREGTDLEIGGEVRLHGLWRAGVMEEARAALNGAPADVGDHNIFTGLLALHAGFALAEDLEGALLISTKPMAEGENVRFGSNPEETDLYIREAWLQADRFPWRNTSIRLGAQSFRFVNRYQDDPFFLDLGESESAWSGTDAGGTTVRADRDTLQPVGLLARWRPEIFLKVTFFSLLLVEGASPSNDESVYGLQASLMAGERTTLKGLATLFAGPAGEDRVGTVGMGLVHAPDRDWMISAEGYLQFGTVAGEEDKRAGALRGEIRRETDWGYLELGGECATGDDPEGDDDEGWQSYENVNRFLILQDALGGLDWDTNYRMVRLSGEVAWGGGLFARGDAGWFSVMEEVAGTGVEDGDQLGFELDGEVFHPLNASTRLSLKVAGLYSSEVLEVLSQDGSEDAWAAMFSVETVF